MSGKKHCKGVDVVCPFWRCETPLTITCEGWMAGFDVQRGSAGRGRSWPTCAGGARLHGRVGEVSGGGGRGEEV